MGLNLGGGIPDQVYQPTKVYSKRINSVGTLTEGYIQNTESLITANNRLGVICEAYNKCIKDEQEL